MLRKRIMRKLRLILRVLFTRRPVYTEGEVDMLVCQITRFNAGAVDPALSRYADKTLKEWKSQQRNSGWRIPK